MKSWEKYLLERKENGYITIDQEQYEAIQRDAEIAGLERARHVIANSAKAIHTRFDAEDLITAEIERLKGQP